MGHAHRPARPSDIRDPDGNLIELSRYAPVEPDFRICGTAARAIADLAEPPPVP
jgi:hypothetical protein